DGDNQAMTRPGTANASRSKRPRDHERELLAPERTAVRPGPLRHHDVRTRIAQRNRPAGRVLEEERLQRARNEVRARNRTRHHPRRTVTRARRGAEDRTIDVRMPKPNRERQLPTCRDTEHRGAIGGQGDPESRPRPAADVRDEELLVCSEPFQVKAWR